MRKIGDLEADQNHLTGDLGNLREEMIEMKELMAEDQTHLKEDQDSLDEEAMRLKMKDNLVVEVKTQDRAVSHPDQHRGKRMRILSRFSLLRENLCTMLRSSSS